MDKSFREAALAAFKRSAMEAQQKRDEGEAEDVRDLEQASPGDETQESITLDPADVAPEEPDEDIASETEEPEEEPEDEGLEGEGEEEEGEDDEEPASEAIPTAKSKKSGKAAMAAAMAKRQRVGAGVKATPGKKVGALASQKKRPGVDLASRKKMRPAAPEPEAETEERKPKLTPKADAKVAKLGKVAGKISAKGGPTAKSPSVKGKASKGLAPKAAVATPKSVAAEEPEPEEAPSKPAAGARSAARSRDVTGTQGSMKVRTGAAAPAAKSSSDSLILFSFILNAILVAGIVVLAIMVLNLSKKVDNQGNRLKALQEKTLPSIEEDVKLIKGFSFLKFGVAGTPAQGMQGVVVKFDKTAKLDGSPKTFPINPE